MAFIGVAATEYSVFYRFHLPFKTADDLFKVAYFRSRTNSCLRAGEGQVIKRQYPFTSKIHLTLKRVRVR